MKTKASILAIAKKFQSENSFPVGDDSKECRTAQAHYSFLIKCSEVAGTQTRAELEKAMEYNYKRIGIFDARCRAVEVLPDTLDADKLALISLLKKDIRPDLAKSQNKIIRFILE